jgi:hypothetical protein
VRRRTLPCWKRRLLSINGNCSSARKHAAISNSAECTIPLSSKICASAMPRARGCGVISWLRVTPWSCCKRTGLVNAQARDAFYRRIVFPCSQVGGVVNLYGRSLGDAFAHRFLPGGKGDLFAWESVRQFPTVILVEGLSISPSCGRPAFATPPAPSAPV